MLSNELEIRDFDPQTASEADFSLLNAFINRMRVETWPEDPTSTAEETRLERRYRPAHIFSREWVIARVDGGEVVANASLSYARAAENQHVAEFRIEVLPEMRRRGLAKELLRQVADVTGAEGRRLLTANTQSPVPAGDAFMNRLGGHRALAAYSNVLHLDQLNRPLLREWQERGVSLQHEFELGLWAGPYPESDLEAIAKLHTVMNTAPRGDMDREDSVPTVDQLREWETAGQQRKHERWTMYVRDRKTSALAGYTELFWNPFQPQTLWQGDTGVFPEYRNRGLGSWLKAAMIEKMLGEHPEVKRIRTWNAQENAPMLMINEQMGFRPHHAVFTWEVSVDRVRAYLHGR